MDVDDYQPKEETNGDDFFESALYAELMAPRLRTRKTPREDDMSDFSRSRSKRSRTREQTPTASATQSRASPPPVDDDPAAVFDDLETTVQALTTVAESNFTALSYDEKLFILQFLLEACIIPSEAVRKYSETCMDQVADLRKDYEAAQKELEDFLGKKPALMSTKKYLEKNLANISKEKDEKEDENEDEKEEEKETTDKDKQLRNLQKQVYAARTLMYQTLAGYNIRTLGRDRYGREYIWFDAGVGIYPYLEERQRGRPKHTNVKTIPWATGRVFVCDHEIKDDGVGIEDPFRHGTWGYLERADQVLFLFLCSY